MIECDGKHRLNIRIRRGPCLSLPGTSHFRRIFCRIIGIARSGGGATALFNPNSNIQPRSNLCVEHCLLNTCLFFGRHVYWSTRSYYERVSGTKFGKSFKDTCTPPYQKKSCNSALAMRATAGTYLGFGEGGGSFQGPMVTYTAQHSFWRSVL